VVSPRIDKKDRTMTRKPVHVGALLAAVTLLWVTACGVQSDPETPDSSEAERSASLEPAAKAHYLANAGVLIVSGETKVVFDPLFRNDYGTYRLLPEDMEQALFAGEPPLDGIDAVLISHYHEDHFSPADIIRLLEEQPAIQLYAPVQAVWGMRSIADASQQEIDARVTEIALEYKDAPLPSKRAPLPSKRYASLTPGGQKGGWT